MSTKPRFALASPYTPQVWPHLSPELQEMIVNELCSLLAPIGTYRKLLAAPSGHKKSRKRKAAEGPDALSPEAPSSTPEIPSIQQFVTVGLNATTRHLEALTKLRKDSQSSLKEGEEENETWNEDETEGAGLSSPRRFTAVFLPKKKDDVIYAHLPTLVELASLAGPDVPACLLVPLEPACEARLSSALHTPRAGVVGLLDGAPGAGPLLEMVRSGVAPVRSGWLGEAMSARFVGTNVTIGKSSVSNPAARDRKAKAAPAV